MGHGWYTAQPRCLIHFYPFLMYSELPGARGKIWGVEQLIDQPQHIRCAHPEGRIMCWEKGKCWSYWMMATTEKVLIDRPDRKMDRQTWQENGSVSLFREITILSLIYIILYYAHVSVIYSLTSVISKTIVSLHCFTPSNLLEKRPL